MIYNGRDGVDVEEWSFCWGRVEGRYLVEGEGRQ